MPEFHGMPCGTAICCAVSVRFSHTASMQNIDITCVSCFFLRLPKTAPTSPFEAYLEDILSILQRFEPLTETSTNRKTLKEHQNNLTLNKP